MSARNCDALRNWRNMASRSAESVPAGRPGSAGCREDGSGGGGKWAVLEKSWLVGKRGLALVMAA